eukprot:COSAG03_NODE_3860_length_1789_cov_1.680473_1_plen_56_part_10
MTAQAHTAQRELAAAAVERKEVEQSAFADITEIRLLLDRDKVSLFLFLSLSLSLSL